MAHLARTSQPARVALLGALALTAAVLPACRGDRSDKPPRIFFPGMDHQPKWEPQAETPFYVDGRVQRSGVVGTIPFGYTTHSPAELDSADWAGWLREDRSAMLGEDDALYRGVSMEIDSTGNPVESYLSHIPAPVTNEMIQRGQERFQIFCTPCHGYLGNAKGTVAARWTYPPANLLGEQYQDRAQRQGKDGYLFHVVREGVKNAQGVQVMPGYGEKVDEGDAWAIVAYLRVLQRSQTATEADVPPEYRRPLASASAAGSGSVASVNEDARGASDSIADASSSTQANPSGGEQ